MLTATSKPSYHALLAHGALQHHRYRRDHKFSNLLHEAHARTTTAPTTTTTIAREKSKSLRHNFSSSSLHSAHPAPSQSVRPTPYDGLTCHT
ncbi:hypothetical protein O3P69_017334 [Scylla paramamosain]|uniref:Uncharacterized protein n=1 Tax=Scylla paramamosain TaxID=85552 RepID=A0AAW0TWR1_SCYPA